MKKMICFLLAAVLLGGCGAENAAEPAVTQVTPTALAGEILPGASAGQDYASRFPGETVIALSDEGITVDGGAETETVYTSHDIIYYEDRDAYDSGNPYGEGTDADKHTAEEAAAHTVVNIVSPGAYRITGRLSAGQLRIDLGEEAYADPDAVVELILENADITCTLAPAILFLNTYECDGGWSVETAGADVDTSAAGANLILQGENTVSGSYVAKIYKDADGEKKLWKQDGAIYSYRSLNVYGPGALDLTAANEGLDTELHLTVHGGDIAIRSQNDGINTNEDGVSVTTVHGGNLRIIAGLGEEGDGIDSNGYLVIRGGTVIASANPAADAGLDSDLGSYIHGGTVVALGSAMDWAESDSGQVTMNLQFADHQTGALTVAREDGTVVFAYDPGEDAVLRENLRRYQGAILSCPGFTKGDSYLVFAGGTLTGQQTNGIYTSVTACRDGTRMGYTGTDVRMGPGGLGGKMPGEMERPEGMEPPEGMERPEGMEPPEGMERPEGMEPPEGMERPEGMEPPEGMERPEGMEPPEGMERPEGMQTPEGMEKPEDGFGGHRTPFSREAAGETGEANGVFYMQDMVNFFSGLKGME